MDKWLKDKVLLPPATTQCAVPKEAAGQGMLRAIAYGSELNMAYPPRPTDPKIAWEPQWAVKLRVKSVRSAMLGMDMSDIQRGSRRTPQGQPAQPSAPQAQPQQDTAPPAAEQKSEDKVKGAVDALRGLFGR